MIQALPMNRGGQQSTFRWRPTRFTRSAGLNSTLRSCPFIQHSFTHTCSFIYIYIYIYIYAHIHTYHMYIYIYIYIYMYVFIHLYTYLYNMCIYVYMHTYIHICSYMFIYVCIYTYMFIHSFTHSALCEAALIVWSRCRLPAEHIPACIICSYTHTHTHTLRGTRISYPDVF